MADCFAMAQPRAINWFRVIVDLGRMRWTYRAIADAVGVSKSTIVNWADGAEPRHGDGERLLALWSAQVGRPVSEAPRSSNEFVQETGQPVGRECVYSFSAR